VSNQFARVRIVTSSTRTLGHNSPKKWLSGGKSIQTIYAIALPMAPTRIYAFCRELSGTELHLLLQLHRLSVRLESIGNVVVALAGLLGVFSAGSGTYAGFIGISLVYGMRVTGMLNWAVRSTTELATQMCVSASPEKAHP
jgi:hypothetical protein